MNKKFLAIGIAFLMAVIVILAITTSAAINRSNETIERVDRHIEEVLNRCSDIEEAENGRSLNGRICISVHQC